MGQCRLQPSTAAAGNRRQRLLLHLAMVGLFLLDLALPRNIPLLPYYFLLEPHVMLGPMRDQAGSVVDFRILQANPVAAAYNFMPLEKFLGSTMREVLSGYATNG